MLHFVINLDRDADRLDAMKRELGQYDLSFERLPAVYGYDLPSETLKQAQVAAHNRRFWLKDFTPGQIGCYFSHFKAWTRLVQSSETWGFIQEDDIKFNIDPRPYLTNTDWIPEGVKLIQAGRIQNKHKVYRKKETLALPTLPNNQELIQVTSDQIGGAMGYFIHRDVATFLCQHHSKILAPADDILFAHASPLLRHFTPWTLRTPLVFDNDQGVSNTRGGKSSNRINSPTLYAHRQYLKLKNKFLCLIAYQKDYLV